MGALGTNGLEVLTYVFMHGFGFAALCAMTRGGRGWPWRLLGYGAFMAGMFLMDRWCGLAHVPLSLCAPASFAVTCTAYAALVVGLARDGWGRPLFLSMAYGTCAACYLPACCAFVYRNALGLPGRWAYGAGMAAAAAANLAFLFGVLPQVPRSDRNLHWSAPCAVVFVLFLHLFGSGIWPIALVRAPARDCLLFVLTSVSSGVAIPAVCYAMRRHLRHVDLAHGLELMAAEVQGRRAAIDLARRLRHDQRHHRVQLAEYLLRGQCDQALAYLGALDAEADQLPAKLVWCENETVNAILSGCVRRAADMGVAFSAEAHVGRKVGLSDVELVAVVANLAENAIRATAKGGEVRVTVRQRAHGFGLAVSNPVPAGFALSAKGMPCEAFGTGMESIRRVVERYRGTWAYALSGGTLTCRLVLMVGGGGVNEDCALRR